uniref:Uncharacterized protein n=1 Tax=Ditylenchus dipsaci TaxID=166011 RepID=A0A915CL91_9BILA
MLVKLKVRSKGRDNWFFSYLGTTTFARAAAAWTTTSTTSFPFFVKIFSNVSSRIIIEPLKTALNELALCSSIACSAIAPALAQRSNFHSQITADCLEQSERRDCSIFNRCCDFRCLSPISGGGRRSVIAQQTSYSRAHFCMAIMGQIVEQSSKCVCSSSAASIYSSYSPLRGSLLKWNNQLRIMTKLDFVGGIILIFILDLFLLSLTI